MEKKSLADVLERFAAVAQAMMDSAAPSDDHHECPICLVRAVGAEAHEADCAYRIACTRISPADVVEVRRLARALRYWG
jgi:hypothetical protein